MNDKKIPFLPFHAINEFMLDDYRQQVIASVLASRESLPADASRHLASLIKKHVAVPGFRNANKAPAGMQRKPAIKAFQKSPQFVAGILAAWAELHPELRQQTYDLLTARGWELLPPDADRTRLPGFMTVWPAGEHFETLVTAFREAYPDSAAGDDDISLMTVWLGGRLPYAQEGETDAPEGGEASSE